MIMLFAALVSVIFLCFEGYSTIYEMFLESMRRSWGGVSGLALGSDLS